MALFKVFRGESQNLDSVTKVDGYAYFCTDDGSFWIDHAEGEEIVRTQINKQAWTEDIEAAVAASDEIYIGEGDMPENATLQIILDGSNEEEMLKNELKKYIDFLIESQINQLSSEKVNKNQGAENVGKILAVGTDGNLVLVDMPEGGASGDVIGTIDENNNILLTGKLADGTYTLKYENEDGSYTDIGTLTLGETVVVNLLETALTPNDITTVFDGKGYKNGYYASAAEPFYNVDAAFFCTGLMPIPSSRTFYIKGCTMDTSLSHTRFGLMMENGGLINTAVLSNWGTAFTFTELGEQYYSVYLDNNHFGEGIGIPYYFYFSASGTGDNVIVSATPIPETDVQINLFEEYTPQLNKRWSNSSHAWSAQPGCVGFELSMSDIVGKKMRFSGFAQAYATTAVPTWYFVDDSNVAVTDGFRIYDVATNEGDGTYSWTVPNNTGATKLMVFLPIKDERIFESDLATVSWILTE